MLTLHHLNNSRSQRVLWLMEELEVPYEIVRYQRDPMTMLAPKELRKIHPLGKSPIITDDGKTLAESGAILEYIVDRYGNGRLAPPRDSAERLRYTYWMHYAEGSAMPPLLLKLVIGRLSKPPVPALIRPITGAVAGRMNKVFIDPQLKLHFDFMEGELEKNAWFVGAEFSAADIQMSFPVEAGEARGMVSNSRPRLVDFLKRIHARPAYQRALDRGGAYQLMS